MSTVLYGVAGSPNALIAQLMLEHKGVPYRRVDVPHVVHRLVVRAFGFPGYTVPALKCGSRRVQGTRAISRFLDDRYPERPPLFPADPERRRRTEEIERWGETDLQPLVRFVFWPALQRDHSEARSFLEGAPMVAPIGLTVRLAPLAIATTLWLYGSDEHRVHEHLMRIPAALDSIDRLIGEGQLGDDVLTAADYQVACTVRILMTLDDLRPLIESRPCGRLAMRVAPGYVGRVPPVLTELERSTLIRQTR